MWLFRLFSNSRKSMNKPVLVRFIHSSLRSLPQSSISERTAPIWYACVLARCAHPHSISLRRSHSEVRLLEPLVIFPLGLMELSVTLLASLPTSAP